MEIREKMQMLEDMLDLEEGTLKEETKLEEIEEWDSVAVLSFIVLMDETFQKSVSSTDIKELKTIQDMLKIME